jgi:hypothetical protein
MITFGGKTVHVKDARGMAYLCQLLQSAGQRMPSFQLAAAGAGQSGDIRLGSAGEILDERAIKEYRDRMEDIESRLSIAERDWDQAQKDRSRRTPGIAD